MSLEAGVTSFPLTPESFIVGLRGFSRVRLQPSSFREESFASTLVSFPEVMQWKMLSSIE